MGWYFGGGGFLHLVWAAAVWRGRLLDLVWVGCVEGRIFDLVRVGGLEGAGLKGPFVSFCLSW